MLLLLGQGSSLGYMPKSLFSMLLHRVLNIVIHAAATLLPAKNFLAFCPINGGEKLY